MNEPQQLTTHPTLVEEPINDDPVKLTTPEEMQKFHELLDYTYQEINPRDHSKLLKTDIFYEVVNIFPKFVGIMETQYVAQVLVSRFKKEPDGKGGFRKVPCEGDLTKPGHAKSFVMNAAEFLGRYKVADKLE